MATTSITDMILRANLHRDGDAYRRAKYSMVKMPTQAVSIQKKAFSKRSPQGLFFKTPFCLPQGTVSITLASTDMAMKNPVT